MKQQIGTACPHFFKHNTLQPDEPEMLEFCARHQIKPLVETFPMSKVNDAMRHLAAGKARYRIVLQADW